ncbi:hypothetical protein [Shewanella sp. 10N.286.48.B5]|uniref:hypothetical protein n=1 Tax=Shewanella sp. 10N.286.48.B5 TaxID=1880834 RepID=UPI000C8358E9|nr:hypothetical protein [Shewanella sp. 10N.286.48.B5]PMH87003.1 hypothetical protein BCU57_08370 [Shewanella sp. 10N.286.48.B5]
MQIPSETDWEDVQNSNDLDAGYAYKIFFGKSLSEVQPDFARNPIERFDELRFMPKIPFQYYIFAFRDFVINVDNLDDWTSDAASCFLSLIAEILENKPEFIAPVYYELEANLEFISQNQGLYEADEDIYGSFKSTMKKIKALSHIAL